MFHELLIEPFSDGDWLIGIVWWAIVLMLTGLFLGFLAYCYDEYQWSQTPSFTMKCKLFSQNYKSSTLKTNAVPVVNFNGGMGMGISTSGEPEKYITVWDCGKYGRIVANSEEVFRFAEDESNLLLKERNNEVRIVGIER